MGGSQKVQLGYTVIQHRPRLENGLSNNDYCVADAIYHLSNNPDSIAPGWCFARREKIGAFFGISRRTVINSLAKLKDKGLVEMDEESGYLRTSNKWYVEFVLFAENKRKQHEG